MRGSAWWQRSNRSLPIGPILSSRWDIQARGRMACLCRAEKSFESVARVLAVLSLDTAPR